MSAFLGPSSAPTPQAVPSIPVRTDEDVRKAGDAATRVKAGRASNYLANPLTDYQAPKPKPSQTLGYM